MITKPTLVLDEKKCKANIAKMHKKALDNNIEFRPHFKTHQSLDIGKWFKDIGVNKITVSSFSMAQYFADEWKDITVAFPTNINEIDTINKLAKKVNLNLTIENTESIKFLANNLKHKVNIFIKIDIGYHRTGIEPNNTELINNILDIISSSSFLTFIGFLGHAGHTYKCKTQQTVQKIHSNSLKIASSLKKQYPDAIISYGDTPSCSIAEDFTGIDEIRPGNFVFYDIMQENIGSCLSSEIALAVACPIVAIHNERLEIVIYGGGVHLSKESLEYNNTNIFGRVVNEIDNGWDNIIPDMYVTSLSQEHGIVSVPKSLINSYSIGDYLLILPVHSCMTANLFKFFKTFNARKINKS